VLEGAFHAGDLGGLDPQPACHIPPGSCDLSDLGNDRSGRPIAQIEIPGRGPDQFDVASPVVWDDGCGENAGLQVQRGGIEVIGGRQGPTVLPRPEEAVIAQVIINIGNEDVEDHVHIAVETAMPSQADTPPVASKSSTQGALAGR